MPPKYCESLALQLTSPFGVVYNAEPNKAIASNTSANEYQYKTRDFDCKYCQPKIIALVKKSKVPIPRTHCLIKVGPEFAKNSGANPAITSAEITATKETQQPSNKLSTIVFRFDVGLGTAETQTIIALRS